MHIYLCALVFFLPLAVVGMQVKLKFGNPETLDCIEDKEPVTYVFWKYKNTTGNVAAKEIFSFSNNKIKILPPFENVIYPAGVFKNGNYSITLRPITFEHEGQYVCYIQIDGSDAEQRSAFIVEVVGWEQNVSVPLRGILNLPLYTNQSVHLHFWRNGTDYTVGKIQINAGKYQLDGRYEDRAEMRDGVLGIYSVTPDDAGVYTVQDEHSGKNISTVIVDITSLNDLRSNFSSENSADVKGGQQQDRSRWGVIAVVVVVVVSVLVICLAKYC